MELEEVIQKRRSIRKYLPKKVEKEILKKILEQGILAPSAKNGQPWRFIVIQGEEALKNKIADLVQKSGEERIAQGKKGESIINTANIMKQAPVLVLVFNSFGEHFLEPNMQSIGACIENICLQATNLGLGSLWIANTNYAKTEIEALFPSQQGNLSAAISLGYADENPLARPRKTIEEVTIWK